LMVGDCLWWSFPQFLNCFVNSPCSIQLPGVWFNLCIMWTRISCIVSSYPPSNAAYSSHFSCHS
jgi:hypothetical protein